MSDGGREREKGDRQTDGERAERERESQFTHSLSIHFNQLTQRGGRLRSGTGVSIGLCNVTIEDQVLQTTSHHRVLPSRLLSRLQKKMGVKQGKG